MLFVLPHQVWTPNLVHFRNHRRCIEYNISRHLLVLASFRRWNRRSRIHASFNVDFIPRLQVA